MKKLLILLSSSICFSLPSVTMLKDDPKDLNFSKLKVSKNGSRLIGYDTSLYSVAKGIKTEIKYQNNDLFATNVSISDDGNKVLEWSTINNDQENTKIHLISFDKNNIATVQTISDEYNETFDNAYIIAINGNYYYFLHSKLGAIYNIVNNKVEPISDTNKSGVIAHDVFVVNNKIFFQKVNQDNNSLYYYDIKTNTAQQILFDDKLFSFQNYQINNNLIYFYDDKNIYQLDTSKSINIEKINMNALDVNKFIIFNNITYFYNNEDYLPEDSNYIYEYKNNNLIQLKNIFANNIINFNNEFLITSDNLNDKVYKIDSKDTTTPIQYKINNKSVDIFANYISENQNNIYFGNNDGELFSLANNQTYAIKLNINANYVVSNEINSYAFSNNGTKTELYSLNNTTTKDLGMIAEEVKNINLLNKTYTLAIDNNFNLYKLDGDNKININDDLGKQIKLNNLSDDIVIANDGIYFNNLFGNSDTSELYNWNYKNII